MKLRIYLKKLLLIIGIMYVGLSFASADVLPMQKTTKATPGENWNVEFKNKYNENIIIGIKYADGDKKQINKAQLLHDGEVIRFAAVNTYRKIIISIWTQGQFGENPENAQQKKPKFTYTIDAGGNTIFVTFDQNGNLNPQRGELLGITGKTESGLSKSSNVQKRDITLNAGVGARIQK